MKKKPKAGGHVLPAPRIPRGEQPGKLPTLKRPRDPKVKASKASGDSTMLKRYEHHHAMADKHRAHADLIEARLRTQGKRIDRYGDMSVAMKPKKPKIVKDR